MRRWFRAVAHRADQAMHELGSDPDSFGLIHGDLTQANYLCHGRDVHVIDFGDFGCGYYLYDMAVTLLMLMRFDTNGSQRAAFLSGYSEIKSLPSGCDMWLDAFISARMVVLAKWILGGRSPSDVDRKWVAEMVELVRTRART
jgi:Ser/Thr protein kinase RdoA (MazF antagonist)